MGVLFYFHQHYVVAKHLDQCNPQNLERCSGKPKVGTEARLPSICLQSHFRGWIFYLHSKNIWSFDNNNEWINKLYNFCILIRFIGIFANAYPVSTNCNEFAAFISARFLASTNPFFKGHWLFEKICECFLCSTANWLIKAYAFSEMPVTAEIQVTGEECIGWSWGRGNIRHNGSHKSMATSSSSQRTNSAWAMSKYQNSR